MNLVVTCGERINASFGVRLNLGDGAGPVELLHAFLAPNSVSNIWWTPFEWDGDRRKSSGWLGGWALVLDVDYYDSTGKHNSLPREVAVVVLRLIRDGVFPGNLAHLTPRGVRLIAVLAEGLVTDRSQFLAAWRRFAELVAQVLRDHELNEPNEPAGLHLDDRVVGDLARYFFLANTAKPIDASDPSSRRCAEVVIMRFEPTRVLDLLEADATSPLPSPARGPHAQGSTDFTAAAELWVADHPTAYPKPGSGTCPICEHNNCFGQLADRPAKWACFSSNHDYQPGWCGTQRNNCWIGSSLDIEANRRGCTPREVLIADSYLANRANAPGKSPHATDHDTTSTKISGTTQANADRKRIRYEPKNLGRALDEVEAILAAEPQPSVFQSAGQLVRIVDDALVGQAARPVAKRISVAEAKALISDRVVFQRVQGKGRQDLAVPDDLAKALVNKTGWALIPKLTGITMVPVMRADGSLYDQAGYDPQTGYFTLLPDLAVDVSPRPTRDEAAAAAYWILDEVFGDFPLKQAHDKAALLAELLTGLLMPTILGSVPAFLHLAPLRGTGKTLLAQLVALILLGERAPATQPPTEETEWRKLLFAAALAGQPFMLFDNVPAGSVLKSSTLDMAITAGAIQDRHLGHSKTGSSALHSLILFTGNNVRLGGDLPRRVIPIVLDSNEDRPERRGGFVHDPIEPWVMTHRGEILGQLFTIARAYRQAFPPCGEHYETGLPRFGGFEAWDQGVRGMVDWLGLGDAAGGVDALHEVADDDTMERAELLEVLKAVFGDREFTSAEVHATASKGEDDPVGIDGNGRPVLSKDARLFHAIRQEGRKLSVNRVTRLLREHVDAPAVGLVLRGTTHSSKKAAWLVEDRVGGEGKSGDSEFSENPTPPSG